MVLILYWESESKIDYTAQDSDLKLTMKKTPTRMKFNVILKSRRKNWSEMEKMRANFPLNL